MSTVRLASHIIFHLALVQSPCSGLYTSPRCSISRAPSFSSVPSLPWNCWLWWLCCRCCLSPPRQYSCGRPRPARSTPLALPLLLLLHLLPFVPRFGRPLLLRSLQQPCVPPSVRPSLRTSCKPLLLLLLVVAPFNSVVVYACLLREVLHFFADSTLSPNLAFAINYYSDTDESSTDLSSPSVRLILCSECNPCRSQRQKRSI